MSKIWYTLSIESAFIERDEDKFVEALGVTGKLGYEYPQHIERNEITWYYTLILKWVPSERIETVTEIYGITPNEKRSRLAEEWDHYLFFLTQQVNEKTAHKIGENLSKLYWGGYIFHTFYKGNSEVRIIQQEAHTPRSILRLFTERNLCDSVNEGKLRIVNEYPIGEIQKYLKRSERFDKLLNRIPHHGTAFEYVHDILGSTIAAYKFFNEHFQTDFKIEQGNMSDYLTEGVSVSLTGSGIIEDKWAYYVLTAKGEEKQITDFTVRVHYKVMKNDQISYIVSLMNQTGFEVKRIEWKNTTSEQMVADFTQKFWPFHFLGSKDHVKKVHALISHTEVPIIYGYQQYGVNEYKGNQILLLPDGVFDITTKKYFPKDEETAIYFLGGNDGMMYTPPLATAVADPKNIAAIGRLEKYTFDDYMSFSNKIYKDDSAWIVWMIACSMAGYMLYAPREETPLYFLTWPTGTGKSTFADILALAFGVKQLYSIGQSTVYTLRVLLSSMHRVPTFVTEYRSSMQYREQKDEMLRMTFDQGNYQRGKQTGEVVSYRLSAQVFLEWEDMYSSGSIRTRTIVHKTRKAGRMEWADVKKLIHDNTDFISTFLGSYISQVSHATYMEAFNEARAILYRPGVEPRIIDNFCTFYAGCVSFAPEHKEIMTEKMISLMMAQQEDYNENGQAAQVIKILSQYVASQYSKVYIQWYSVIVSWDDILAFCNRERKKMELSEDANYDLLIDYGFEGDMYQVNGTDEWNATEQYMINGLKIHIARCPNKLYTNKHIYKLYLDYQKSVWK